MKSLKLFVCIIVCLLLVGCKHTHVNDEEKIIIPKVEQIEQVEKESEIEPKIQQTELETKEQQTEIDNTYLDSFLIEKALVDGTLDLTEYLTRYEPRVILEYVLTDKSKLFTFIDCMLNYVLNYSGSTVDSLLKSFEVEMLDMNFEQKCLENFSNININPRTQLDLDKLFLNKNVVARCYYLYFLLDDDITNKNINTVVHNLSRDIMYTLYLGTVEDLKNLLEEDKDISIYTDIIDFFDDASYIFRDDYDYKEIDLESGAFSIFECLIIKNKVNIKDRKEKLQLLIDYGYDINRNIKGGTPLIHAFYCGDKDAINVLIDNGVDINEKDENDRPIVYYILNDINVDNFDIKMELLYMLLVESKIELDEDSREYIESILNNHMWDWAAILKHLSEDIIQNYTRSTEEICNLCKTKTIEERIAMIHTDYWELVLKDATLENLDKIITNGIKDFTLNSVYR